MATRKAPAGYAPALPPGCVQRYIQEGDEQGILDLLTRAFDGVWPRHGISVAPIVHLRWKLNNHPLAARLHLVAELDGRIISVRPMWVCPVKVRERELLTRYAIDRAVAPEFQRKRVMTAMEARTPDDWFARFDVLLGVVNNWQSISYVPGTPYRRKIDVVGRLLDGVIPTPGDVNWSIRPVKAFDDRVDELWRRASHDFVYAAVRTSAVLNYRYADRRSGDYTIALAEQGETLLGYVVYSSWQGTGQIADVLVLPGRQDVLESLVAFALRDLQQAGSSTVECWRDLHHPYRPALDKLGFVELQRRQGMTLHSVRGPDDSVAFFADPKAAVHIMAGDTDLV